MLLDEVVDHRLGQLQVAGHVENIQCHRLRRLVRYVAGIVGRGLVGRRRGTAAADRQGAECAADLRSGCIGSSPRVGAVVTRGTEARHGAGGVADDRARRARCRGLDEVDGIVEQGPAGTRPRSGRPPVPAAGPWSGPAGPSGTWRCRRADHAEVAGHRDAAGVQPGQQPDRDQVVVGHDRGRAGRDGLVGGHAAFVRRREVAQRHKKKGRVEYAESMSPNPPSRAKNANAWRMNSS